MAGELEVVGLTKSFQRHRAVDDVSLRIEQGQFVCFLGPSGCGKTTLLRMIAGLEAPTSGHILLNGRNITAVPAHERNFGMVFQALALFPHLNVEENIAYSLRLRSMDLRARKERVKELLQLVHLPGSEKRSVGQLSGGQRQRVAIARALAQEPRLFLMDEPLSALDAQLRDHMQVEIRQLQQKLKITTIVVTHDQKEAMTIADQVVVMADGKVQQVGSPVDVYRRPANRFVAGFLGQSNLIDVEIVDRNSVRFDEALVPVEAVPTDLAAGTRATLCVRPENVRLSAPGAGLSTLSGEVAFVRDLGSNVEVRIRCGRSDITAVTSPLDWASLPSHRELSVGFAREAATVLLN